MSKENNSDNKKQRLFINRYFDRKGKEFITLKDKNGILIRRFRYNEKRKNIKNFHLEKEASEESIKNYFAKRHKKETGQKYIPTSQEEYEKKAVILSEYKKEERKKSRVFRNENRLIFTGKKQVKNFDYVYINVKVKVYFDGVYVIANGRSDYIYHRQIKESEKIFYVNQAMRRAIAPYGSNVSFKPISWQYVYHQRKFLDFDKVI